MTWVDNLKNVGTFTLNDSLINDTDNMIPAMVNNANDTTGYLWYYTVMIIMWMFLVWKFYKRDEDIRLDIMRSMFIASSWGLFISSAMVLSELVVNILPTIWFGVIWFLTGVAVIGLRRKGQ